MDRNIIRRTYNQFDLGVDLSSPDGMKRQQEFERHVDKMLAPLKEAGQVLKRTHLDEDAARRTVHYAYHGPKKIQDSIKALLADMPSNMGYGDTPAPFTITNRGRKHWTELSERILDPRMNVSMMAKVLNAGGVSTHDKVSGFTKLLIPGTMKQDGLADSIMQDISARNAKFLAGELPSSALADGASPKTLLEGKQAQIARRDKLKAADKIALQEYIAKYPDSPTAMDEAAKQLKIKNRDDKERLRKAEQTPGTPEFQAMEDRKWNKRVAEDSAATEWAKRHRKNPVAKAILKNRRNRTAGGRALNKALSIARFGVMGALLSGITTAVNVMVKFLSGLPALAGDVRRIANKGAQFNITEDLMKQYRALGKAMGMDKNGELFSAAQGNIYAKLGDMIHGDLNASISAMAAVSALAGNSSINAMVEYYRGIINNPDKVMRTVTNDVMKLSFMRKAVGKDGDDFTINDAFSSNVLAAEIDFGMGALLTYMFEYWQKLDPSKGEEIRKKVVEEDADFITLMWEHLGKPLSDRDVAGGVTAEHAEEVAKSFDRLKALYESIRGGILLKILALMEPMSNYLRMLLIHALEYLNKKGPLEGQLVNTISHLYDENIKINMEDSATVENQMRLTQIQVETLRNNYDMNNPAKRKEAREQISKGLTPAGMKWEDAAAWDAIEFLYDSQKKDMDTLMSPEGLRGEVLVSGTSSTAQGDLVAARIARTNNRRAELMENLLSKYGVEDINTESLEMLQNTLIKAVEEQGVKYVGYEHAKREARPPGEPVWRTIMNIFKRLPAIAKAAKAAIQIGGVELSLDELEDDILALETLRSELPDSPVDDKVLFLRDVRRGKVANALEFSENMVVLSQVHDKIGHEIGSSYLQDIKNRTAEFHVKFDTEKREYTIHVKDLQGNIIGSAKDIYMPGIKSRITADSLFNTLTGFEDLSPTPLGSEDG